MNNTKRNSNKARSRRNAARIRAEKFRVRHLTKRDYSIENHKTSNQFFYATTGTIQDKHGNTFLINEDRFNAFTEGTNGTEVLEALKWP